MIKRATSTNSTEVIKSFCYGIDNKCKDFDFSSLQFDKDEWIELLKDFKVGSKIRVTVEVSDE